MARASLVYKNPPPPPPIEEVILRLTPEEARDLYNIIMSDGIHAHWGSAVAIGNALFNAGISSSGPVVRERNSWGT